MRGKPIARSIVVGVIVGWLCLSGSALATAPRALPEDPLQSVMWKNMAERFFPGDHIVIDQRVIVDIPIEVEDQMQLPVTVDATELKDVVEIVALADLNPIPHILTIRPLKAQAFIGFRVKVEQSTPIRVGVLTKDGVWHVNGVNVSAAGGGCTAPANAHSNSQWYKTLGQARAITKRESPGSARLAMRLRHPMDTGLAPGIPVFYMNKLQVRSASGEALADLELFEPVSENPTLTLKPLVGDGEEELLVYARDTEGNEFEYPLTVPAEIEQ